MDTSVKPSFIPKRPLSVVTAQPRKHVNIFGLLAFIVFFAAIILAAGVFVWRISLERDIRSLQTDLEEAKKALDPEVISELSALATRMQVARQLLNNQRSLSSLFGLIEPVTMRNVRFKNLTATPQQGGQLSISMDGEALSFATLALQTDEILKKQDIFRQPTFSNIMVDKNGVVTFRFSAQVDGNAISYRERIENEMTLSEPVASTAAASSTASTTNPGN